MKTIKNTVLILALLLITISSKAATPPYTNYGNTLNDLITGFKTSDAKLLKKVLSESVTMKVPRNNEVYTQSRAQLIDYYTKLSGTVLDCKSNITIIEKSDAMIIANVKMIFPNFTDHNYVTLEKDDNGEWKVAQIYRFVGISNDAKKEIVQN